MTGAVRQPFILCNSVISIYLCLSPDFPRCKRVQWSGERLPLGACGQTEDVIYFPANCAGVTNISSHYNLSPGVKIYRWHRRMRFSSASQKKTTDLFLKQWFSDAVYRTRRWFMSIRVRVTAISNESAPSCFLLMPILHFALELGVVHKMNSFNIFKYP